ncbi:two-component system regulatory protein YycI [Latilactobacillus fuchuensis]|uniref:YycH family protein n=1 Tax=Latilactobacillus fuchuensis DSM 14340 = JCM 11249 TaxID=1423747 RepID=A0A0R1RZY4_9LACO|nr:two-component system regulatory protein YycI [Latilactobacillus fuchuensis]KRL59187.1 yycH family protein [Latilactobacillus fuchuensis DSM 14340 = JCM 11249]
MDFRRIEMIFIAIFIALDIYLFISLKDNQAVSSTAITSGSQTSQILKDLKDDQITVKPLSNAKEDGYYLASRQKDQTKLATSSQQLTNQVVSFDKTQKTLISELDKPLTYRKNHALLAVKAFMKSNNNVVLADQYRYSPELSSDQQVVFVQKVPGGVMMDEHGQLVFLIEDGQINQYTQTYANKIQILREKEMTKVSAKEAVIDLYTDNEIPNNSKVSWVKLGYSALLDANSSTVYVPVWQVAIENKNSKSVVVKRINAFTGALMKNRSDVQ